MKNEKITVTFVMPSKLMVGGGAEIAAMEYIEYADKKRFNINVIQTDHMGLQRLTDKYVQEKISGSSLYTIPDIDWRFSFLKKNKFTKGFFYIVIRPILMNMLRYTKNAKTFEKIKNSDVIYLFQNEMAPYFSGFKGKVIGHGGFWVINPSSVIFKLVCAGLMWHRIDGFRLFPYAEQYSVSLNKKFNLILTNGVDCSLFYPDLKFNERTPKFLFVGRTDLEKGIDILLNAAERIMPKYDFELHIAGDGNMKEVILSSNLPNLKYHGLLTGEDLYDLYRKCDVFVFPTKWDPFPLVIFEALSSGLTVLVSDVKRGSYDEFEKLGFLHYVKNDPENYAEAMVKAIEKIDEIRKSKQEIHELIVKNNNLDVVSSKLYEFFTTISDR